MLTPFSILQEMQFFFFFGGGGELGGQLKGGHTYLQGSSFVHFESPFELSLEM